MGDEMVSVKKIKFYLHIYKVILIQDIKCKLSYRSDFMISIIGMLLSNASNFIAFWIMFQNFPSILGWSYYEMLFLYGFSLIALTPSQCFFDNNWNLRENVYTGNFIKYCFRPINVFFYYMSEVFDLKGLGQFVFGIITLCYAWEKLSISFSFIIFIKLIISLITASLFMVSLMNVAASVCFWSVNSDVLLVFAFRFKDYSKYPVTIFNSVFRFIFTFLIPIAFVAYYPSLLFLRPNKIPLLTFLSPVIGVSFFCISYKLWIKGAKSYSGTGS